MISQAAENWAEWLKARIPDYEIYVKSSMVSPILAKLDALQGHCFIEWGCGSAYISIALGNKGHIVQAFDINPDCIDWAKQNTLKYLFTTKGNVSFVNDVDQLKKVDIVFSQGLMEHFDNENIIALLKQQILYAQNAAMFSVPSKFYDQQDYGDERLMTVAEWEAILAPAFGDRLHELYYYDQKRFVMGVIKV